MWPPWTLQSVFILQLHVCRTVLAKKKLLDYTAAGAGEKEYPEAMALGAFLLGSKGPYAEMPTFKNQNQYSERGKKQYFDPKKVFCKK